MTICDLCRAEKRPGAGIHLKDEYVVDGVREVCDACWEELSAFDFAVQDAARKALDRIKRRHWIDVFRALIAKKRNNAQGAPPAHTRTENEE